MTATATASPSSTSAIRRWFASSMSPVTRAEATFIGLFGLVLAGYSRLQSGERPGVVFPDGFYGYYDQGAYLRITRRLADFELPQNVFEYVYGLGYPILGVPFQWIGFEGDPFFPVDTIAFAFVGASTAIVGSRIAGRTCGLVAAALVMMASPVLELMTIPWNSTVSIAGLMIALLAATSPNGQRWQTALVIGLAAGWTFSARYPDGIAVGLVGVVPLMFSRSRKAWTLVLTATAASFLVLIPVFWTHDHVLGSWHTTPYASHVQGPDSTSDQSIDNYDIGRVPTHAVETFVTARAFGMKEPRDPFLLRTPWLVMAPFGVLAAFRTRLSYRSLLAGGFAVSIVFSIFYLSFVAGGGGNIKFGNFRYWSMWVPLWAILSVVAGQWILGKLAAIGRAPEADDDPPPLDDPEPDDDPEPVDDESPRQTV